MAEGRDPGNGDRQQGGSRVAARRVTRQRLSGGHLLMVGAGLLGLVLTVGLLRQADRREEVAVAAGALLPGTVLETDHLGWSRVRLADEVPALRRVDVDDAVGMVVTNRVAQGELLSPHDLRPPAAAEGRRAMSIPLARSRAVDGALGAGDRVDVIHVVAGDADLVAADVEVLAVADARAGTLGTGTDELAITLAVSEEEALAVASALGEGQVVLVRATGTVDPSDDGADGSGSGP